MFPSIQLSTGYGYPRLTANGYCHNTPWHIRDHAEAEARQLRFTQAIVVSTRGTMFDGALSILPGW